jgi:septum formation protein
LVEILARRKAEAVADPTGTSLVVGCDSVLDFEGQAHGKPASVEQARQWLVAMRGKSGTLFTGHCVIDESTGRQASAVGATTVRFAVTTDAELEAYLATGEALAVAGAFTLDGRSAPFIEGIVGDSGNVIGLSLPVLRTLLASLGVAITDLWVGR